MCCLFASLLLLGPRAVIILWWLVSPGQWALAFDTPIVPILGFLFLPWTTLMYVAVFPGGLDTLDWIGIALALVIDIGSWSSGGITGRRRYYSSSGTY